MRLRQVVLAAADLDPVEAQLRAALPLGPSYADPGVAEFGLRNAVMPLGDTFVEIVQPIDPTQPTAVGRHLARHGGDAGYMVLVEVDDLSPARARAEALGARVVWEIELEDIAAVHLHPRDTGGALLSLDQPRPAGAWRWAGPDWAPGGAPGVLGATIAVPDPEGVAARWGALLARDARDAAIAFDDGTVVRFERGDAGLCAVEVAEGRPATVAGVRFSARG